MAFQIDDCLRRMVELEGSDLHLKVSSPPVARIHGSLQPLPDHEQLRPEDTEAALEQVLQGDGDKREEFDADGEVDLAYELKGVSRFRVNAFRQRGAVSIVCRAIPFQVRTIEDLGLPEVIRNLADEQRGIVLLTGTTGSGKSTTLAAMIDHINSNYAHHVITLEDPIEYLHRDKRSIINQREVGSDTRSFSRAMKRVLRQDPDVILVGEMRDEETVRTALSAAETGHLVLSTLHTLDATETINRIIDFFPPHLQQQARVMLASTLRGAVSQRLVPTVDGSGRVAAAEILVVTGRVQDLILNPNETGKISQVIAEGEYYGMQTFDQSLLAQVAAGRVSEEVAMGYATSPHDFKLMQASSGKRASDLSQLLGAEQPGGADVGGGAGALGDPLGAPAPAGVDASPERPLVEAPSSAGGDPASADVEYGSPDHAYGRSAIPRRPPPDGPADDGT
jgi:twitching motility protein PilT